MTDSSDPMLRLGYLTAILPDCDTRAVFETAAAIGYDSVELACWPQGGATRRYAGVTHYDVTAPPGELHALARETGVAVSSIGYYPNALSADDAEADAAAEHLRACLRFAGESGIGRVTTFVGRDPVRSVDDNWPAFERRWEPLIRLAEECGVRIGIENCPMLFTADEWPGGKNLAFSPAIWRRMFATFDSPHFGLNYDPSHLIWMQMDPIAPLAEFADRLVHVHAKDVRVDRARLNDLGTLAHPNEYHTPKLPGLGELDWGRFFAALTGAGYRGDVVVEVEDRAYEGSLADRHAALVQCHDFLRQFVPRQVTP